jgi:4-diphosphocytidyl-2-C-methyl-D-erythritol kinase
MAGISSKGWPAPAKINRFLHITGQRADGYHLLQTVFQFLDYADQIDFSLRDDGQVCMQTPMDSVADEDNLMVRAARLLQPFTDGPAGVDIHIHKRLPMGGGLGGGSSDAATVLVALNHLWQLHHSPPFLSQLGVQLGADIPVFVHGHAAWAEGIGEELQDIALDEPWFCVIVPAVHVSTAEIFADQELTRNSSPIKIADFLQGKGRNDCEALVCKRYKGVAEVIEWMKTHVDHLPACVLPTRMTGTGACVYAAMQTEQDARAISAQLPAGWNAFVAKGLNQSPLLQRLQQEG